MRAYKFFQFLRIRRCVLSIKFAAFHGISDVSQIVNENILLLLLNIVDKFLFAETLVTVK